MSLDLSRCLKLDVACWRHRLFVVADAPDISPVEPTPLRSTGDRIDEQAERQRNGIQKCRLALSIAGDQNCQVGTEFNRAILEAAEIVQAH